MKLVTRDGASWSGAASSPNRQGVLAMDWVGDDGWAVGNGGSIVHGADAGVTWTAKRSGFDRGEVGAIDCIDAQRCWALGGAGILRTTTGGDDEP